MCDPFCEVCGGELQPDRKGGPGLTQAGSVFSSKVSLRIPLPLPFASFVTQATRFAPQSSFLVVLLQQPQRHKLSVKVPAFSLSPSFPCLWISYILDLCVCGGGLGDATQVFCQYPHSTLYDSPCVFRISF